MIEMTKRILIVEDEPITAMSEKQMLVNLGHEVTDIVLTGESAVQRAGVSKPDVVLMDIKLIGEMDGTEASLKIIDRYKIPVIFVTAFGSKKKSKSLRYPPPQSIGYIVKPFTQEDLGSEIRRLVG